MDTGVNQNKYCEFNLVEDIILTKSTPLFLFKCRFCRKLILNSYAFIVFKVQCNITYCFVNNTFKSWIYYPLKTILYYGVYWNFSSVSFLSKLSSIMEFIGIFQSEYNILLDKRKYCLLLLPPFQNTCRSQPLHTCQYTTLTINIFNYI